ncbi:MAG: septal ring lytic transglycosylase RlpA family protein [Pseudomonadota bacterium]
MGESGISCTRESLRAAARGLAGLALVAWPLALSAQPTPTASSEAQNFSEAFATLGAPDPLTTPPQGAVDLATLEIPRGPMVLEDLGSGVASYYGQRFHGRRTANGERFDMNAMTAAHKTLPFGTYVRVTNPANRRSVTVRINDRGPFIRGRTIDLSRAAAQKIGMIQRGHASVTMEIVAP